MKKCLLLICIIGFLTLPVYAGEGSFSVVYVPADDRPLNDQQMRLFAQSLGVELIMPDRVLYGRNHRDDRGEIFSWLMDQEGDHYIISLDGLLSGGLLESRRLAEQSPITLPSGEVLTEKAVINRLKEKTAGKQVYFLDSLLRLACSVEEERDMALYDATLSYGRGDALTKQQQACLDEILEHYLSVRQRKLRLNLYAARTLPGYLLGVDDGWAGETIQTAELKKLGQYLASEQVHSTFDGLARLALAKLYLEETGGSPGVTVRYFGDETVTPAHNYEPAEKMTEKALSFFGTVGGDDLEVLILTEPEYGKAVLRAVRENQTKKIPTILINLCPREEGFEKGFLTIAPGQLLSYAGYGSSVNALHLGLSMGLARYACITKNEAVHDAHIMFLATLLADEFGYAAIAKEVRAQAGGLGLGIHDFRGEYFRLERFTAEKMAKKTEPVFRSLSKGGILTAVSPYTVSQAPEVTFTGGYFPWHRCFEYHAVLRVSACAGE